MNKRNVKTMIEIYINDLRSALSESTLYREIGTAPISLEKSFFLLLPLLNEGQYDDKKLQQAALSIGAIHAALDVHDKINRIDATEPNQQLTVLAGDHFSGIHYRILAEAGEFALIRELSQTIARINEQKTALLSNPIITPELLVERISVIESACISCFYSLFGFSAYQHLTENALTYLRLQRMIELDELKVYEVEPSIIREALKLAQQNFNSAIKKAIFLQPVLTEMIQEYYTFGNVKVD